MSGMWIKGGAHDAAIKAAQAHENELLEAGGVFDRRPGDLEATKQTQPEAGLRLVAQMGMRDGKGVVVLLRDGNRIATLDPTEAYRLAEAMAGIADIIGHRAREARD